MRSHQDEQHFRSDRTADFRCHGVGVRVRIMIKVRRTSLWRDFVVMDLNRHFVNIGLLHCTR